MLLRDSVRIVSRATSPLKEGLWGRNFISMNIDGGAQVDYRGLIYRGISSHIPAYLVLLFTFWSRTSNVYSIEQLSLVGLLSCF